MVLGARGCYPRGRCRFYGFFLGGGFAYIAASQVGGWTGGGVGTKTDGLAVGRDVAGDAVGDNVLRQQCRSHRILDSTESLHILGLKAFISSQLTSRSMLLVPAQSENASASVTPTAGGAGSAGQHDPTQTIPNSWSVVQISGWLESSAVQTASLTRLEGQLAAAVVARARRAMTGKPLQPRATVDTSCASGLAMPPPQSQATVRLRCLW